MFIEDLGEHEKKHEKLINGHIDKYRIELCCFHKDGSIILDFDMCLIGLF